MNMNSVGQPHLSLSHCKVVSVLCIHCNLSLFLFPCECNLLWYVINREFMSFVHLSLPFRHSAGAVPCLASQFFFFSFFVICLFLHSYNYTGKKKKHYLDTHTLFFSIGSIALIGVATVKVGQCWQQIHL